MILSDSQFNTLFIKHKKQIECISSDLTKNNNYPRREMIDLLKVEFWRLIDEFDPTRNASLRGFLEVRLKQTGIDEIKKKDNQVFYNLERIDKIKEESDSDESAATFEVASDFDLEDFVINGKEKKTGAEKLQLINALSKNADPLTISIINEYLSNPRIGPTAIGRKLGFKHHSEVTRRLKKLSKAYDESKFGDLDNYITA